MILFIDKSRTHSGLCVADPDAQVCGRIHASATRLPNLPVSSAEERRTLYELDSPALRPRPHPAHPTRLSPFSVLQGSVSCRTSITNFATFHSGQQQPSPARVRATQWGVVAAPGVAWGAWMGKLEYVHLAQTYAFTKIGYYILGIA